MMLSATSVKYGTDLNCAIIFRIEKLERRGYQTVKSLIMFSRFHTIHERDRYRRTPRHGICRAYA